MTSVFQAGVHVPDPQDDDRLIADCLSLAPGAWEGFLARFGGLFRHVVRRTALLTKTSEGSEDLDDAVAEIVLEILRNDARVLRSYAGRSGLAAYLAVIARRVALRRLFRIQSRDVPESAEPLDTHDDVATILTKDEIASLLTHLNEADARLVRLHHLESRSYGEISRVTGLPLGSIGPALARARRQMREAATGGAVPDAGTMAHKAMAEDGKEESSPRQAG